MEAFSELIIIKYFLIDLAETEVLTVGIYDRYHENIYDTDALEAMVKDLIIDDEVQNKSGIYYYILTHEEK